MRNMSVSGSFYPASSQEIEKYIEHFTKVYDKHFTLPTCTPKALIVPHAGYIYSGFTANVAYRLLAKSGLKRFVVIGPSHRVGFEGVSMCKEGAYATPLGGLEADTQILLKLKNEFGLKPLITHEEHSTEVQFPFIKHYIPDAKIVELVYGRANTDFLSEIITSLLQQPDIGVIISTDLSHYYPLDKAKILDHICIDAIENLSVAKLHQGCEACGILGVEGMLKAAKKLHLASQILDYRTSADASGDVQGVVGYLSVCFL